MKINDLEINYTQYGNNNGKNVVLLHGWGQNIEMMDPIGQGLKDAFFITIIDLPGFGKSREPKRHTTIYNYREILYEILQKLNISNPIMVGHSFGGKISILYAEKYGVEKLVLLASPYKKSKNKKSLKVKLLKLMKKIPFTSELANLMQEKIGSTDYKNASRSMKDVLVNSVNEDLEPSLKKIAAPTLLIWGSNDTAVSVEDAKYAEKIIPNAGLVIYENRTHYAYLEELGRTIIILQEFFKKDGDTK